MMTAKATAEKWINNLNPNTPEAAEEEAIRSRPIRPIQAPPVPPARPIKPLLAIEAEQALKTKAKASAEQLEADLEYQKSLAIYEVNHATYKDNLELLRHRNEATIRENAETKTAIKLYDEGQGHFVTFLREYLGTEPYDHCFPFIPTDPASIARDEKANPQAALKAVLDFYNKIDTTHPARLLQEIQACTHSGTTSTVTALSNQLTELYRRSEDAKAPLPEPHKVSYLTQAMQRGHLKDSLYFSQQTSEFLNSSVTFVEAVRLYKIAEEKHKNKPLFISTGNSGNSNNNNNSKAMSIVDRRISSSNSSNNTKHCDHCATNKPSVAHTHNTSECRVKGSNNNSNKKQSTNTAVNTNRRPSADNRNNSTNNVTNEVRTSAPYINRNAGNTNNSSSAAGGGGNTNSNLSAAGGGGGTSLYRQQNSQSRPRVNFVSTEIDDEEEEFVLMSKSTDDCEDEYLLSDDEDEEKIIQELWNAGVNAGIAAQQREEADLARLANNNPQDHVLDIYDGTNNRYTVHLKPREIMPATATGQDPWILTVVDSTGKTLNHQTFSQQLDDVIVSVNKYCDIIHPHTADQAFLHISLPPTQSDRQHADNDNDDDDSIPQLVVIEKNDLCKSASKDHITSVGETCLDTINRKRDRDDDDDISGAAFMITNNATHEDQNSRNQYLDSGASTTLVSSDVAVANYQNDTTEMTTAGNGTIITYGRGSIGPINKVRYNPTSKDSLISVGQFDRLHATTIFRNGVAQIYLKINADHLP